MSLIHIHNLTKHFKILNRWKGLSGAFRDLFSGNYRTMEAVAGISFDIEPCQIVGYIGPNGAVESTTIKMTTGIPQAHESSHSGERADALRQPHPPGTDHVRLFAITHWIWTKGVNSYTGTGS